MTLNANDGKKQAYYFEIEKLEINLMTFAYIYREGEDAGTAPPVKEFHSLLFGCEAERKVSQRAEKWIRLNGAFCEPPVESLHNANDVDPEMISKKAYHSKDEEGAQTAYCENCDADYFSFANCPQCGR